MIVLRCKICGQKFKAKSKGSALKLILKHYIQKHEEEIPEKVRRMIKK